MEATHLNAGAIGSLRLVLNDGDRRRLLRAVRDKFGILLLAWCIMDTHIHIVVECAKVHAIRWFEEALALYARGFNAANASKQPLLRGPVHATPVPDSPYELVRAIYYVHDNPCSPHKPIVGRPIEFEWSSAREYASFSGAATTNAKRGLDLAERFGVALTAGRPSLADLEAASHSAHSPALLLAAACQTLLVDPSEAQECSRDVAVVAARSVYARLGALERFDQRLLGPPLRRSQSQISRLAREPVDLDLVRIARTLVRVDALRARLLRKEAGNDAAAA